MNGTGSDIMIEDLQKNARTPVMALRCDVCGAEASGTGRPFSPATLAIHKQRYHGPSGAEFVCDVCGATASRRGTRFKTRQDVQNHKAKAHRKAVDASEKAGAVAVRSKRKTNGVRLMFCPSCGCDLHALRKAIKLSHGMDEGA
jgi:hypothetical protein